MGTHNTDLGRRGEDAAADWYRAAGYRVLDRNWRCPRGEIDLVVRQAQTVVIVEVKTRAGHRFGSGFDAVDHRKQHRLRRLALLWLAEQRDQGGNGSPFYSEIRFDVVDVDAEGRVQVRHCCF